MTEADRKIQAANLLPPLFIIIVVGTIWSVYVWLHLLPTLQLKVPSDQVDAVLFHKGVWHTAISQSLLLMFVICFLRALLSHPGAVPNQPEWVMGSKGDIHQGLTTRETKGSTGDRRFCKWCQTYKPDRCHHCRICKQCVLKMDHHCPWIMNCVGFNNHKYFFLLVVYAVLNCLFIIPTISESVQRSVVEETRSIHRFMLVLGLTLSIIMGVLMSSFLSFHTWLMFKGMSTIEFCEKNLSGGPKPGGNGVSYDVGPLKNMQAVLGPYWWLWLLPLAPAEGDGLNFPEGERPRTPKQEEPEWTGQGDATA